LREWVKEEVLSIEQIINAKGRRPMVIHAVGTARVHDEPLAPLIGVGMHVGVIERCVQLATVPAGQRECETVRRLIRDIEADGANMAAELPSTEVKRRSGRANDAAWLADHAPRRTDHAVS
jgi:hypothetical protein